MTKRSLNVLLLFDVPYEPPNDRPPGEYMIGDDWRDERDVIRTLTRLGHKVTAFGVYDDIQPLVEHVRALKPDVIFNQCESFRADRAHEPNLPALLELLGVPYTGARAEALALCKDKGLTKKLLAFHEVRVPRFATIERRQTKPSVRKELGRFAYPGLCKPLGLDSSEGIARASLVTSGDEAAERVRYIHEKLGTDAIVEEYIDGRELYVGVLGNEKLTVLPPTELDFGRLPASAPRVLTYKAKWDQAYRKKYRIDSHPAKDLGEETTAKVVEMARTVYRLCKITGYARVDLRLDPAGEPVFLEVNPNPSIKRRDDFAEAAKHAGTTYEELLDRLLTLALAG